MRHSELEIGYLPTGNESLRATEVVRRGFADLGAGL
jgi:hypothetical protein